MPPVSESKPGKNKLSKSFAIRIHPLMASAFVAAMANEKLSASHSA